jgi:hypothetical protein
LSSYYSWILNFLDQETKAFWDLINPMSSIILTEALNGIAVHVFKNKKISYEF